MVWVEPVADPPCVTRGTVYERVPGQSIPVKEPLRLAALYAGGETARLAARTDAAAICDELAGRTLLTDIGYPTSGTGFCVGLATTGRGDDIERILFSRAFTEHAYSVVGHGASQGPLASSLRMEQGQSSLWLDAPATHARLRWSFLATWDGAVALACDADKQDYWQETVMVSHLVAAWTKLADAAQRLGCRGAYTVAIRVKSTEFDTTPLQTVEEFGPGLLPLLVRGPVSEIPSAESQGSAARIGDT